MFLTQVLISSRITNGTLSSHCYFTLAKLKPLYSSPIRSKTNSGGQRQRQRQTEPLMASMLQDKRVDPYSPRTEAGHLH